ncbi:MAG: hypothetical protein R3C03_00480 [Pirellulaceae bacterium]
MAVDYVRLENIHYLLKKRSDLAEQLARCPRVVRVTELALADMEKKLDAAKTAWQECKKAADAKQMTMSQRESRIEGLKGKRNSCDSNREFQLLNEQIAADEQANSVLADEILELLERADTLHEGIEKAKANVASAQKEVDRVQGEVAAKEERLQNEINKVNSELKVDESHLSGDFLLEYRRRVDGQNELALAATEGETCGNCHQLINTQMLSELYQRMAVFCKGCGAIMYMSRDSMASRDQ